MFNSSLHVAIIMDGNGRWAERQGLPRLAGHRAGEKAVERTIESAAALGITDLTLYAFSSDNWKRPAAEVRGLMALLRTYLKSEVERCVANGVRLQVIGRRDRLQDDLLGLIDSAEGKTRSCSRITVRIAIDYSARDSLVAAAGSCKGRWTREDIAARLPAPDVDLLVRTGGEQRLSDFLLWEAAYAELVFLPVMWPDFDASHLREAVTIFKSRQRRFGAVPAA